MIFKRSNPTAVDQFWSWFRNADLLEAEGHLLLQRLVPELKKVQELLVAEVTPAGTSPRELIISADGMVEAVDAVDTLVDRAPQLEGWRFIRFRPPLPNYASLAIQTDDSLLDPAQLRFVYGEEEGVRRIDIFCDWFSEPGPGDTAIYMLLDMAIGEFNVMSALDFIYVYPIDHAPDDARAWHELQSLFFID